jgi:hypothetical protein
MDGVEGRSGLALADVGPQREAVSVAVAALSRRLPRHPALDDHPRATPLEDAQWMAAARGKSLASGLPNGR